jgi:hypothetical protein
MSQVTKSKRSNPLKKRAAKSKLKEKTDKAKATKQIDVKTTTKETKEKTPKAKDEKKEKKEKKEKDEKKEKKEKKTKRRINLNTCLCETSGLCISVARCKNIMDNFMLNHSEYKASQEIKNATHRTKKNAAGEVIKLPSVPLSQLSQETQDLIVSSKYFFDRGAKEIYEKEKLQSFSADDKKNYDNQKKLAKMKFEESMNVVPESKRSVFDVEEFNKTYSNSFYIGFTEPATELDEWQQALNSISHSRARFSANSKIMVSSFIEFLLQQLAINGTFNCIQNKKKIIKCSHALQVGEDVPEHFSLFPFVSNTKTYKKFMKSQKIAAAAEVVDEDLPDDEPDAVESADFDNRPNFHFYLSENCRYVRMKLASGEIKVNGDNTEDISVYNLTNVSRRFKDFCNDLIFETVTVLGNMILTEMQTCGVKTLNNRITKTVMEHLHSAYGLDFTPTLQFMETATTKYNAFVKLRRETRKSATGTVSTEEYDVKYEDE